MVLNLTLTHDVEAALARSAALAGVSESEYVAHVLESHLGAREILGATPRRSILELRGLGAEMWRKELNGRDAQDVVNEDRDRWSSQAAKINPVQVRGAGD